MLLRERPKAIISTGGGMSIATALLGKLLGVKLIYVESGARVTSPSRTGKLLYKYADLFIVQWEPMLKHFPKAVYGGMLF
jgi:UDP-N-acetylglucosamine:LPS N-acetylglucosamine transferase